jgi:hypothetical protein
MLQMHIISSSRVGELARHQYDRHKLALDLIRENRPDRQLAIFQLVGRLVDDQPSLLRDRPVGKSLFRFIPYQWDVRELRRPNNGTNYDHALFLEFQNAHKGNKRLTLNLVAGDAIDALKMRLRGVAVEHGHIFRVPQDSELKRNWPNFFQREFVTPTEYQEAEMDLIEDEIRSNWAKFLETDLPAIGQALRDAGVFDSRMA